MDLVSLLRKLTARHDLTRGEMRAAINALMDGQVEPSLMAAWLAALATKGESVAELVGAAEALRSRATPVRVPPGVSAIDTCGTGGDGQPLFNVSTAVAIVAAAAGATVAKHGNRSNVRPSGSAEVLAALGVAVEAEVGVLERCLADVRIAFLYAPQLHPAMRHAAPVRQALGIRTIFNLAGPLANPAGVRRQLVGVNRAEYVEPVATALAELGAERALVVHGCEGLCDLSIAGPSRVARWDGRTLRRETVGPEVIGLRAQGLEGLHVRDAAESAASIRRVLGGTPGPARDMVVLNTAAALWVADLASDWGMGAELAERAIEGGAARETLERWIECTRSAG